MMVAINSSNGGEKFGSTPVLIEHPHAPSFKRRPKRARYNSCVCACSNLILFLACVVASGVLLGTKPWARDEPTDPVSRLVKSALIAERPWEDGPPRWCRQLMAHPRERPRTSSVYDCRRGRFGAVCEDGHPAFFSQYNQDMWTWSEHWRHLRRPGVYLDVAANEPVRISNTYFFDRCLRWRGVCVEPHPGYTRLLVAHRSCAVLPLCLSNRSSNATFALDGGSSGVVGTNKNPKARSGAKRIKVMCVPTKIALAVAAARQVDMLSLDVEGHEHLVLEGIDWSRTRINVIVIESLNNRSLALLRGMGYKRVPTPRKAKMSAPGAMYSDFVFSHPSVVWGKPV